MLLGSWWMDAAIKAQVEFLPIINIDHHEETVVEVQHVEDVNIGAL